MILCVDHLGRISSNKSDFHHFYSDLGKMWSSNMFFDPILRLSVKLCTTVCKYFHFCLAQYHCYGDFGWKQENSLNNTRWRTIFDTSNKDVRDHYGRFHIIRWISKRKKVSESVKRIAHLQIWLRDLAKATVSKRCSLSPNVVAVQKIVNFLRQKRILSVLLLSKGELCVVE